MSSKPTIRIGKRFCERLGHELQQCATYCARNKWDDAERTYQDVEQMLDTFRTETGITAYLENKDADEVPAPAVAAKSEPAKKSKGAAKKNPKRTKPAGKSSGATPSADGGSTSDGGLVGSGVADRPVTNK